jgi:hypothetical protein
MEMEILPPGASMQFLKFFGSVLENQIERANPNILLAIVFRLEFERV